MISDFVYRMFVISLRPIIYFVALYNYCRDNQRQPKRLTFYRLRYINSLKMSFYHKYNRWSSYFVYWYNVELFWVRKRSSVIYVFIDACKAEIKMYGTKTIPYLRVTSNLNQQSWLIVTVLTAMLLHLIRSFWAETIITK